MFRLIKDSALTPSWTHTLSVPTLIGMTVWFIVGGVDLTLPGGMHIVTAAKSGSEYALAIAPWIALLGNREWAKKGDASAPDSSAAR